MTGVPRNRRGLKGVDGLRQQVADLKAEVALLKPQIMKRECDYENRRQMEHNEKVLLLERELEATKLKTTCRRAGARSSATRRWPTRAARSSLRSVYASRGRCWRQSEL